MYGTYNRKDRVVVKGILKKSVYWLIHWLDNALLFSVSPTIFHHPLEYIGAFKNLTDVQTFK